MKPIERNALVFFAAILFAAPPAAAAEKARLLLTTDGTHSWAQKEAAFDSLVAELGGFAVEKTKDLDRWLPQNIKDYDVVVIHTTGGTLNLEQANGLRGFVEAGGGLVGIHCATDSFKNSDVYWELLGGRFREHGGGKFTVEIADAFHPAMRGIKDFEVNDEDYQHDYHPRAGLRVLMKKKGDDRNMVWVKRVGKGRVFYIANGDNPGVFQNGGFRKVLGNGLVWASGDRVPPSREGEEGFEPIFDGKSLAGWEGDEKLWRARDGLLVGTSPGIRHNDFLCSKKEWGDFELRLQFRVVKGQGNTGVQVRSKRIPGHVSGYQADIGEGYWGCLYDEERRNKVLVQAAKGWDAAIEKDGWNDYAIRCEGDRVLLKINGFTTVDYKEPDPAIARSGIVALQIHSGGPMEVQYSDLRVKTLGK